jgi:23S rRNA pseudouridine1911/1915/1917 synthase
MAMRAFEIVHQDEHVVVVDKAAGVLTVPTPRREKNTLVDLLGKALRTRVFVVHRLDRDTSGLLVFAKSERVARALIGSWSEHERRYTAIVHGVVERDEGTIESRLVTERNLDRRSTRRAGEGERAVTHYRVVRRSKDITELDVTLETGRRNQIRVHLAEMGHPIIGDTRYARNAPAARTHPRRLALHARTLRFVHPVTKETVSFEAPLPASLRALMAGADVAAPVARPPRPRLT